MLKGFEPIVTEHSRVLILGSMPSVVSLEKTEYYGFKLNRFWKIMERFTQCSFSNYEAKVAFIMEHDLALWDVIAYCEREGSLDSKIKNVVCNDIEHLLQEHPTITSVICNGKKASSLFNQYFSNLNVEVYHLPSTSNANRTIKEEVLFESWMEVLKRLRINQATN